MGEKVDLHIGGYHLTEAIGTGCRIDGGKKYDGKANRMNRYFVVIAILLWFLPGVCPGQATQSTQPIQPVEKPRVAVIDFVVRGDVGIKDAGEVVAELLVTRLPEDRFQLVERSQLAAILKEIDLTIASVRDNPEKVYGKLKGVKYIILGSVNKLGNLIITARLVNVATGDVAQKAEVSAEDARGLQEAIGKLANELTGMTAEERDKAFAQLMAQAKAIMKSMPSDTTKLTSAQKSQLNDALKAIQAALLYKPSDREALAVKAKIDSYLGPEKEIALDLGNNVTMKLVLIPAGKFTMGSPDNEKDRHKDEGPQREVTISKPFYMGVYEVTQEQYEQIMGKNPSRFKGANNPVENVSWDDVVEFCKKISQKTGKTVQLPTEAQWEYACRAGSKTRFGFGDDDDKLGDYAWYTENSDVKTHPVGQKKPNEWGFYDMHGNVWEWCSDWYADSYANANKQDPQGPGTGSHRVLRGGCWGLSPGICRSVRRAWFFPVFRSCHLGFRVSVDLK